jgi:hypothetical protein
MARHTRQRIALSIVFSVLLTATTIVTQGRYAIKATADGEVKDQAMLDQIPTVSSIYQGREYPTLTPFFMKDDQASIELGFPKLPDNIRPEMTIEEGQTVSIEFPENPIRVKAFLVDYDADVPVGYPLEEVSKNTFKVTPEGVKTLEVQVAFPGNKQIFYSTLVDVVGIS